MLTGLGLVVVASPAQASTSQTPVPTPAPLGAAMVRAEATGHQGREPQPISKSPIPVDTTTVTSSAPTTPDPADLAPSGATDVQTATTNDYTNSDGTHTLYASSVPINYQDSNNAWHPIDSHLVTDPSVSGGFVNAANSWRVHFGPSNIGVSVDNGASGSLGFAPRGGQLVKPVLGADGVSVVYPNVWPNVDLKYTVTSFGVQESLLLKSPSAATSYDFSARSGSLAQVLETTSGASTVPTFAPGAHGGFTPTGSLSGHLNFVDPSVVDANGAEVSGTGASLAAGTGKLTVSIDPTWLAAQPASAFPIDLDPGINEGEQTQYDYKSDGYNCTNCGVQIGNSRSAGEGDTYWRSLTAFNLSQLNGKVVEGDSVGASEITGASGAYVVSMYHASAFSYAGAVSGSILANGHPGSSGTLTDYNNDLKNYLQGVADGSGNYGYFGFVGNEAPGVYTYYDYAVAMTVNYDNRPTVAEPVSPPSPANGSTPHSLAYTFKATATDPDGDSLQYDFIVSTDPTMQSNIVFQSGWSTSTTATWTSQPSVWNTKLYWHANVRDSYAVTTADYIDSFTPTNSPPSAASQSGSQPADQAVVATPTPTLTVPAATDSNGDAVSYDFTISGSDTGAGRASSGWQATPSWTVPQGVLEDGHAYQWSVATADGPASSTGPWSITPAAWNSTVTVNQRLGLSGPSPMDMMTGAQVNLANGNLVVSTQTHAMTTVGGRLGLGFTYNSLASPTSGLTGQYYADNDRQWNFATAGQPLLVRVDPTLDMRWKQAGYPAAPPGLPTTQYMVRWTGYVTLPQGDPSGTYQFGIESDDAARIYWNGNYSTPIYSDWGQYHPAQSTPQWSSTISLTPGQPVPIEVDYYNQGGPAQLSFFVQGTDSNTSAAVGSQIVPSTWMAPTLSALPAGWTLSLPGPTSTYTHASIGNNVVVLTDSDGAAHTYQATSDGGYTPPAGEDGVLAVNAGAVTLHDSDGSVYTFDAQGNPLSATSAIDSLHPAAATYQYDTSFTPARVTSITDPVSGQKIYLYYGNDSNCSRPGGYDQVVANNLLCGVKYWDNTTTGIYYQNGALATIQEPNSQYTEFGYTGGLLSSIKSPLAVAWQAADPANRAAAPVTTDIGYTWVAPQSAGSTNIRPTYTPVSAPYPVGSVPLVTSITEPSPDGSTTTPRPEDTYTYVGLNETQVHVAGLATTVDRDVTYDASGRVLSSTTATGQKVTTNWDAGGQDLPVSITDPAGRETTTVYDWADRATDSYGPAPSACFQSNGTPVASPPTSCGTIPHTHTGYDTNTTGTRIPGLEASVWANPNQSGVPGNRITASPDSSSWTAAQQTALRSLGGSAEYSGELALPPATYKLNATVGDKVNDGIRVYVDGQPVLDRWMTLNQAILGDQPTGFWRLNDAAGSTSASNEISGGSAGSNSGATFGASGPGAVDTSSSAAFNGSSSEVSLPNSSVPDGSGAFTIESWVKLASTVGNSTNMIVTKDTANGPTNNPYELRYQNGHFQFLEADGTNFYTATSTISPSLGAWHQVVATKTATGIVTLYVDGHLDSTNGTFPTSVPTNSLSALIGGRNDGTGFFNGSIANVALYPYALSDLQVGNHYTAANATLASSSNPTFTTLTTPIASGSLPAAPASTPRTIRIDYRNPAALANVGLTATNTTTGTVTPITGAVLDPRFGLPTYKVVDDTAGLPSGAETTATNYSSNGLDPSYGLATDSIIDPGATSHLNLDTQTAYEAPGASGYVRETTRSLPSATPGNSAQAHSVTYYGDAQTRDIPCPGAATGVNQAGLPDIATEQTPAAGPPVASEAVYDSAGRIAASRDVNDGNVWACTAYDAQGRISQQSIPALNGAAARTINYNYSVGGNPLVSSVTDGEGTTTTTIDLLGRVVAYVDSTGTTTTTSYNQAGQAWQQVLAAPGGGTSTVNTSYLDDGRVNSVTLDGKTVASANYNSAAQLTGVSYPTGTGNSGNGSSLTGVTYDAAGRQTTESWSLPNSHTYSDSLILSQAGRATADNSTIDGATQAAWSYGYDNAGRLTSASLAAVGARPTVTYGYGFAASGGCGADPNAGLDSARTSQTVTVGTGAPQTTTYCTDYATRLTSVGGVGAIPSSQITYNGHGSMTQLGAQSFVYDASDRVTSLSVTGTGGATQTVSYGLDSSGRMVTRTATGTGSAAENDSTTYAYADGSDHPAAQLTATNLLGERYLSLPGGVLLTRHYNFSGTDSWAYPDLHGNVVLTSDATGAVTGSHYLYDPFGQPIDPSTGQTNPSAAPTTRSNGPTDAWHGKSQRGYENTGGDNAILMGARLYLPAFGQFTSPDPILGGNSNPYTYPADPINLSDLTGRCGLFGISCSAIATGVGLVAAAVAVVATAPAVVVVATVVAVGSSAYLAHQDCHSVNISCGLDVAGVVTGVADIAAGAVLRAINADAEADRAALKAAKSEMPEGQYRRAIKASKARGASVATGRAAVGAASNVVSVAGAVQVVVQIVNTMISFL